MNASVDTDIFIHLYDAGKKEVIYSFFSGLYIYEYLLESEMRLKAFLAYQNFYQDLSCGKLNLITDEYLRERKIKGLFDEYCLEYKYLFDSGEMYALALAKTLGIPVLISDDTKEYGPHDTLCRELVEDVIPFAFYELLFLRYLKSELSVGDLHSEFDAIANKMRNRMNFRSRMKRVAKRFNSKQGTLRDQEWIEEFCEEHYINWKGKMKELKNYLKQLP